MGVLPITAGSGSIRLYLAKLGCDYFLNANFNLKLRAINPSL